jgi:hypothetical protein
MAELVQLHTAQVLHSQEPAPTALRVEGVPNAKVLSALDSLVPVTNAERRMRPEHAWDWRRMIAGASGRVAHHTSAVGGPRAANRLGKAVAPGAVAQQTCQTWRPSPRGCAMPGQPGTIWSPSPWSLPPREQCPPRGGAPPEARDDRGRAANTRADSQVLQCRSGRRRSSPRTTCITAQRHRKEVPFGNH